MAVHPYYPLDADLPNFTPNEQSTLSLVTSLSLSLLVILFSSWAAIQPKKRGLSRSEALTMMWFILCGTLHIGFEGYFVLNFKSLSYKQTLLAQLWKEYALSDSRYLTQDVQVLCLETISVTVWGPLSLLAAKWMAQRDARRHVLQTIVSVGHVYSVALYYSTSFVELHLSNKSYSRPEPLYFWGYFIGANFPWVIIPACIIYGCLREVNDARRT